MRSFAVAALVLFLLCVGGCKKKSRSNRFFPSIPKPEFLVTQVFVQEGGNIQVTIVLSHEPEDDPLDVELEASDPTRVLVPPIVTFAVGVTSKVVTFSTVADADLLGHTVVVTASANGSSDEIGVVMSEADVTLGAAHGPVAFSTGVAVLVGAGPDGSLATADDVLRVASGVGNGMPTFTDVTIGAVTPGPHSLPVVTGVSGRVLVLTNGPDLTLGTVDDTLVEVNGIGGTLTVSETIVVGRMESSEARRPVMVGTRAVIAHRGADLLTNGDDGILVIDGIGTGTLTSTPVALPGLAFDAPSIPVMFDATTALVVRTGPDFVFGGIDDTISVLTGIGGAVVVTDGMGRMSAGRMGQPVVVSSTAAAILDPGADIVFGSVDDRLNVIRGLPAAPMGTAIVIGETANDTDQGLVSTGGDAILVPLRGVDLASGTADDTVVLVTSLSAGALVVSAPLSAPSPFAGAPGRLVALSTTVAARLSRGTDGTAGTADDSLSILGALTGVPAASSFTTGASADVTPLASSVSSLVLVGEGADGFSGSDDDLTLEVVGIGTGTVTLQTGHTGVFKPAGVPILVAITGGGNIVLCRTCGPDAAPNSADDILESAPIP